MDRKKKRWLLALTFILLLGMLGLVLSLRVERQTARGLLLRAASSAAPLPEPGRASPTPSAEPSPEPGPEQAVEEAFSAFLRNQTGNWSLGFRRLPEGETLLCPREAGPMVSASLIKLYIMGAVWDALERGTLEHDAADAPLAAMITVSDNESANRLIFLLGQGDAEAGMAAVNDWCQRLGYGDTRLNRLMLADNGLQNYTSAADCAAFLSAVCRGECVSPQASREMLELLLQQQVNDRLPALLPEGTPVAHKTGDLTGLCWADAGIVFSPGGDYVLCLISDGQIEGGAAKAAQAALSRQIYEIINPS